MSNTTKSKSNTAMLASIRKFSEDSHLRPFLSSHFDSQAYIKGVIADGKSEECFSEISKSIEEVNEEIKGYISAHHENLMGGMQDVALLASRYDNLSQNAKKVKSNIDHLKLEALNCHELIRMRSTELERIHRTSIILRQFRQFMHAKGQLDYYLRTNQATISSSESNHDKNATMSKDHIMINGVSFDIRNLANTAAKLVYELETLIHIPILCDIITVSSSADYIRNLGRQLRQSTQDRFIMSIKDRSQASIAACLQIFYHLQILPEVLLYAIDHFVKVASDASMDMLDLSSLVAEHSDLASQSSLARTSSLSSSSTSSAIPAISSSTSSSLPRKGNQHVITIPFPTTSSIRRSIHEYVNNWISYLHEQSLQIHILQRVIIKKEDPNTQMKFSDILRQATSSSTSSSSSSSSHYHLLASSKLVELYWNRLIASIQEICHRYVKTQPVASSRVYPYIRSAGLNMMKNMIGSSSAGAVVHDGEMITAAAAQDDTCMFDSLSWQSYNILDSISFSSSMNRKYNMSSSNHITESSSSSLSSSSSRVRSNTLTSSDIISSNDLDSNEIGFIAGFKPYRDRYLIGALSRMNIPVHQMFPEMEGYTAAIPSKRDLQTLVKSIESELVHVIIESDVGLIRYVSREALKSLQLISSKVEDMILNTHDVKKIQVNPQHHHNNNMFIKNHAQEHNAQLIILLSQLKDAILKLPDHVLSSVNQELIQSSTSSSTSATAASNQDITKEISSIFHAAITAIDDLAARQLYAPLLDNLILYLESILINIPSKEFISSSSTTSSSLTSSSSPIECSKAIQLLQKHIPELLQAYLLQLPKSSIRAHILEEFALRFMHKYVTIAAIIRPMNEASRLRASQDLSAIEDMLVSIATIADSNTCRIVQEFKAFRRLLFMDDKSQASNMHPPSKASILALPYISHLRPSTVLGYFIACAPAQLPLPYEVSGSSLSSYIHLLTSMDDLTPAIPSIRSNYISSWKRSKAEVEVWRLIQVSLDTFLQRISVLDGKQKATMRLWYELILDLGGYYFDK